MVNPLASIVIAVLVDRERLRDSAWALPAELVSLALLGTATIMLIGASHRVSRRPG